MPYCIQCGHPADLKTPENDSRPRLCCPTCGHIHYENPKVVAGTLCVHEGKILLCRRAIEPRYGAWTLPAGFLEIGESMRDGAVRETLEEADAIATESQLYALFDLPEFGQIHVMYLAHLKDGAFGCGTESLECRLFGLDEIPWDELSFRTVIKTLEYYVEDAKHHGEALADYPLYETVIED